MALETTVLHYLIPGGVDGQPKIYFKTSSVYEQINADTGIVEVENPTGLERVYLANELVRTGTIMAFYALCEGTPQGKPKRKRYVKFYVERSKLPSLFKATTSEVDNKTFVQGGTTWTILRVGTQRDTYLEAN